MRIIAVLFFCFQMLLTTTHAQEERSLAEASFSVETMNAESSYVVLCARFGGEEWLGVARNLAKARDARAVVVFDTERPDDLLPLLKQFEPEYVAYVMPPTLLSPDLAGKLAQLSSRIHPDKLIDYASGYITGLTAQDAQRLIDRTLEREAMEMPIPYVCTGIGHSWYDLQDKYLVLSSRECKEGPTLTLADAEGNSKVLTARADVTVAESFPDHNYQGVSQRQSLIVTHPTGSHSLIAFDPIDATEWKQAVLTVPVAPTRQKLSVQITLGVSPLRSAWTESTVTWNDAPAIDRKTVVTTEVDRTTKSVSVDVTSLLAKMQHGIALYCHATDRDMSEPLRHMYRFMSLYVDQSRARGFRGTAIEALDGDIWRRDRLNMLQPLDQGGLILFGGHGSGSNSCLVSVDDLEKLEIGPSVVLNGTCFGAATHQVVYGGDDRTPHRLLRTMDPEESFALQMLSRGTLGYIGGTAGCSFGHVLPAISLLRDDHESIGKAVQLLQNEFIDPVQVDQWDAGGMQPGDPGFPKIGPQKARSHPTLIQITIRTICLGDPAFVPFPR
jgi:hypothetical protein